MAADYNSPLIAALEPSHRGQLGKQFSFAAAQPDNVELTWLKRAEDSDALVVRLVEWHGQAGMARVTLACDVQSAHKANLLEDVMEEVKVEDRGVSLTMRPHEIATVIVECER
jgi:alpha-mannosidase